MDASSYAFKYYGGGTYTDDNCSSKKLNHAMLLVGYGTYGGQDYWIVKNRYAKYAIKNTTGKQLKQY